MKTIKFALIAAAVISLISCNQEGNDPIQPEQQGMLVLNNGNWGSNDASVSIYDPDTRTVSGEAFFAANSMHLGDLGQDIAAVGDDIYIAVNGSKVIFVTDRNLRLKATVEAVVNDSKLSPRCFALAGGKVYVTYYEGWLGEIDPATYAVRVTAVGPNPDGLAFAGGKLYVANSGGYLPTFNNTVSVVDVASFKEVATVEVNDNPAAVVASSNGKYVYVSSLGNYADSAPMLQVIDVASSKVSDCAYGEVSGIAMGGEGYLIVACGGYDEDWNISATLWKHDANANIKAGRLTETAVSPFYSISADSKSGDVFVGTSNYTTNGDIYWFGADGALLDKFDTQGLNPLKVLKL